MRPGKVFLLILAVLVPVAAVAALGFLAQLRHQEDRALAEAEGFARSAAHLLDATLVGTLDEVQGAARAPRLTRALARGDREAIEGFAEDLAADPDLDAVAVLDPAGNRMVVRGSAELLPLGNGANRPPLELAAGPPGGPALAIYRAPVDVDGGVAGELVVVGILDVAGEVLVQARSRIAPTLLVGADGHVLIGPPSWLGQPVTVEMAARAPEVRISRPGVSALGAGEPLALPDAGGEVVTLITPTLLGPRVPTPAVATGLAIALLAAGATLFWILRVARAERRLASREREVAALGEVAQEAATSTDRVRPMLVAGRKAAELAGAEECCMVLRSNGGAQLLRAHPAPDLEPSPLDLSTRPRVTRVLHTGRRESGAVPGEPGRREIWTPIVIHGRVIGALGLTGADLPLDDRNVERALDGIAATLASAIEGQESLQQLERQRAMLTRVVEASPEGLSVLDAEDRVILDNPAMREFFRVEGNLMGQTMPSVVTRFVERGGQLETDFQVAESLARARAGVPTRGTLRFGFGDTTRHGESLMAPLRLPGGEPGVLVMLRDVTERAELAEVRRLHRRVGEMAEVAASRAALLESVLGASEVGFVFVDRQGTIGYVTELAARLLGLEVLPKGLPVKVLEDMIAARTDDDVTGILDRGGPLRIAGEPRRFLAVHIGEVHGESGILAGRLISIRDETSQRELELAREEFLGVAAHELKNPLAALQLQAELGLRGEATKRAEALDKIRRKSHELTQLVERLLDVTRADLGRLVTELVPVDLGELAADVAEGFAGGAAEVRVSPEEGARVVGDPTRIRQVVTNLLSNAVRYAGDRGPIDLEVRRAGDEVRVAVRDRGPGIAEAERARIFERFGQGRTGKRGPGLGIGLYLARRIAEEHGGRLELATEVGKGSTFTLVLPARPVERPVAQNRPA